MHDTTETTWRTSTRCDAGACVEVAQDGGLVLVRDSKNPAGPQAQFDAEGWEEFLRRVKDGAA